MAKINAYLTFNGNCREAMAFYQECLGGELTLQTLGDAEEDIPVELRQVILHAVLVADSLVLMGSDMVGEKGLQRGNSVSLCLNCTGEEEIRRLYYRLSEGGQATDPLEDTFWGDLFGGLTDQFGNHWILNYNRS
ncbi:MAG TPA: VOC family protein [Flavilitoribacter sp.]|nr:VOC family protein [Flavilitoribacter sp.]HMQ88471.1 VOC family protein [Flavilitoribacter sp.]